MKPRLIVDGYNVIYAWPRLAAVMREQGFDDARRQLITELSAYAASTATRVSLVFDSHSRPRGQGDMETIDGIEILYGSKQQTADHIIERLCFEAKDADRSAQVVVITNDKLQRALVGAMGVATMTVDALRRDLEMSAAERSREITQRAQKAAGSRRLEAGLDAETLERLERMRRGE